MGYYHGKMRSLRLDNYVKKQRLPWTAGRVRTNAGDEAQKGPDRMPGLQVNLPTSCHNIALLGRYFFELFFEKPDFFSKRLDVSKID